MTKQKSIARRRCLALLSVTTVTIFPSIAGANEGPPAPSRAAGLWELKHIGGGGTIIGTQTLCVSAASEARENVFDDIALNVNCSKYARSLAGGVWTFEFVCGPADMTSTTKGTISGDFASAYKVEMTESDGTMEMSRTIQATHKGACPAGVEAGTLMDDTGKIITNTLE